MKNQVLSIEQMQHLKKLGVDTSKASMVLLYTDDEGEIIEWDDADEFPEKFVELHDAETGNYDHSYRKDCGVFTLQDILDLLPKEIFYDETRFRLRTERFDDIWSVIYFGFDNTMLVSFDMNNLLNAAYEMLCWCIKEGYIKTNNDK